MKNYRKWSWDEAGISDGKKYIAWKEVCSFSAKVMASTPGAPFDVTVAASDGTSILISAGSVLRRILSLQLPTAQQLGMRSLVSEAEGYILQQAGARLAEELRQALAAGRQIPFEGGWLSAEGVEYGGQFVANERIGFAQRIWWGVCLGCLNKDGQPWSWPLVPKENVFLFESHFLSIVRSNKPTLPRDIVEQDRRLDFRYFSIDGGGIEFKEYVIFGATHRIPWHALLDCAVVRRQESIYLQVTYRDDAGELLHKEFGGEPSFGYLELACAYLEAFQLATQAGEI